jgi:hypothetical protein
MNTAWTRARAVRKRRQWFVILSWATAGGQCASIFASRPLHGTKQGDGGLWYRKRSPCRDEPSTFSEKTLATLVENKGESDMCFGDDDEPATSPWWCDHLVDLKC